MIICTWYAARSGFFFPLLFIIWYCRDSPWICFMVTALKLGQSYNYTIPVYGVATICHQFRWLRWGYPSLFHTAMSLLIWYKMFCVRDISYRLIWMEFITCFPCMHNLGRTVVLIDKLLWFCHTTLLFWCVWRSPTPPNSSGNVQKHGHLLRFQVNGR